MAKIKVVLEHPLYNGMVITIGAPCECSAVTGLTVYSDGVSKSFAFRDAHGNDLTGLGNLFSEGAYIRAVLDTENGYAYIQNADTNGYIERMLAEKFSKNEDFVLTEGIHFGAELPAPGNNGRTFVKVLTPTESQVIQPSNPVFFEDGISGASGVVGVSDSKNRVARYEFTTSAAAAGISFEKGSLSLGAGALPGLKFQITTDDSSYANAGENYDGAELTWEYNEYDNWYTFSGELSAELLPNTKYYLWIFPTTTTYGWLYWNYKDDVTATIFGRKRHGQIYLDTGTEWILCSYGSVIVDGGDSGSGGENGTTFTPAVDADGNLSWTNDGGLANPATVNIKGPQGDAYVLTDDDKQEIADIVADSSAEETVLTPQVVDNTYLQWYSSSNHQLGAYVSTYDNARFKTHRYTVHTGAKYRLYGTGVRLVADYALAVFSTNETPSTTEPGALILEATTTEQDFDFEYTPTEDGYLTVAIDTNFGMLSVNKQGKPEIKLQVFGDSMTDRSWTTIPGWVDFVAEKLTNFDITLDNQAIGGNTLAKYTVPAGYEWPSGNVLTEDTDKGIAYQIAEQGALDGAADMVIIWAGANDWKSNVDLGSLGSADSTTIHGAVKAIIETAAANQSQLLFITPLQRMHTESTVPDATLEENEKGQKINGDGTSLEQVADAILEECAYYAIPCLDMYHTSGINVLNIGQFTTDGLHSNELGAKRLATLIAHAVESRF